MFDVDDALCHNVARVLTSLIESKNSPTGIFGAHATHRKSQLHARISVALDALGLSL